MKMTVPWIPSAGAQRPLPLREPLLGDPGDHLHRPVHRRHEVDLHHQAEVLDRVDRGLAGLLVHLDGELVAGDAGRGDADGGGPVLADIRSNVFGGRPRRSRRRSWPRPGASPSGR